MSYQPRAQKTDIGLRRCGTPPGVSDPVLEFQPMMYAGVNVSTTTDTVQTRYYGQPSDCNTPTAASTDRITDAKTFM